MSTVSMLRARDIMTREIVTLRPDTGIVDAIGVLLYHNISGAPVVDEASTLLGLLSELDCLRVLALGTYTEETHEAVRTVAEFMTGVPHTIPPDREIYAIAGDFLTRPIRRLPVVEDGRLVGQVSRRDVLRGIQRMTQAGQRLTSTTPQAVGLYLSITDTDPGVIATRNR